MGTLAVQLLAAALAACTLALAVAAARLHTRARQALHAAHHDWLTGLPNRRNLDQRLTAMVRSGRAAAVAMLDLDRFKHINDTLGHPAGDQILIAVAHRLRDLPADAVFRQGGDEFVILIDATDPRSAAEVAKQAWQVITTPRMCDSDGNLLPQVMASIGVAFTWPGCTTSELMRAASQAMRHAKNTGTGVHIGPSRAA